MRNESCPSISSRSAVSKRMLAMALLSMEETRVNQSREKSYSTQTQQKRRIPGNGCSEAISRRALTTQVAIRSGENQDKKAAQSTLTVFSRRLMAKTIFLSFVLTPLPKFGLTSSRLL